MLPLIPLALTLAPSLARWLGGNDAGAVTAQVAEVARAVVGTDDAGQVAARIDADPSKRADLQVELARIAVEYDAREHEARVEEMRVAAADRASARQMAQSGSALAWGAATVTGLSFALLAAVLASLVFADIPAGNREIVNMLAGLIATAFISAVTFWVGSSAGSAGKSGLMGGSGTLPFGQGRG